MEKPNLHTVTKPTQAAEKLDLNIASEAEIAKIPVVGLILAKRIVSVRQQIGGFQSFDEFVQIIGLKEHHAERIKHHVEISKFEKPATQPSRSGRLIDY
nr:helix-hairpin-helix domain-containing protein [Bacillus sp. B15-48]